MLPEMFRERAVATQHELKLKQGINKDMQAAVKCNLSLV